MGSARSEVPHRAGVCRTVGPPGSVAPIPGSAASTAYTDQGRLNDPHSVPPPSRGAHDHRSDPATKGRFPADAEVTVTPRDEAVAARITTRYGHAMVDSRAGDVVVDLAQTEPVDSGCVVDLAQRDVTAAGTSSATGGRSPDRSGAGRLSPSWPSVLRVTNAFGTADVIDTRDGASG